MAESLRAAGHLVFVPHEQHYNQIMNDTAHTVTDREIYEEDVEAMQESEACVVVGRVGVDCAFEIGWFEGRNLPVYYYLPESVQTDRHPMFYRVMQFGLCRSVHNLIDRLGTAPKMKHLNQQLDVLWAAEYGGTK